MADNQPKKCPDCRGKGYFFLATNPKEDTPCPTCRGEGTLSPKVGAKKKEPTHDREGNKYLSKEEIADTAMGIPGTKPTAPQPSKEPKVCKRTLGDGEVHFWREGKDSCSCNEFRREKKTTPSPPSEAPHELRDAIEEGIAMAQDIDYNKKKEIVDRDWDRTVDYFSALISRKQKEAVREVLLRIKGATHLMVWPQTSIEERAVEQAVIEDELTNLSDDQA